MKQYTVTEATRLKEFTDQTCAQASFVLRTLLKNKDVRVNGERVAADVPLKKGDVVCYYLSKAQEARIGFDVVFEDEQVLVVDKESGVNSEAVYTALCERGETYFIHRLDRNTAGVMVFAKTPKAEEVLLKAFRERKIEKTYEALVVGKFREKHQVLTAYLKKDEKKSEVTVSSKPIGEKIVTEYRVLKEYDDSSLLEVTLHTGKTHQIRAHLAYVGHPVAGDTKYGDNGFNRAHHLTRQRLVAKRLKLLLDEYPQTFHSRHTAAEPTI